MTQVRWLGVVLVVANVMMFSIPSALLGQQITNSPFLDDVILTLIRADLLDDRYNQNSEVGREICNAGASVSSRSFCSYVDNIGKGICYAGASSSSLSLCSYVDNIEEGLSYLPRQVTDTSWAWDEINAAYGRGRTWRCRGIQTGRFAEDYRCSGLPRVDYRWPGE